MCTSFTLTTKDKVSFLSRTMDFDIELNAKPIFIPRGYKYSKFLDNETPVKYAFVGAGRYVPKVEDEFLFVDGVNEKGLSMATLYFPQIASYNEKMIDGKINLAPHQFGSYLLANCQNLDEVRQLVETISIYDQKMPFVNKVLPFHWIISDSTGACIVIEPMPNTGLVVKENPVGVMTNSPSLEWHLDNLKNYANLKPRPDFKSAFGDNDVTPWGVGANTFALPGGFIPAERFVKATYLKSNYAPIPKGEDDGLNAAIHILNQMDIPKGVNRIKLGIIEYTQYKSIMCTSTSDYYFIPYMNQVPFKISMTEKLLSRTEPKVFKIEETQTTINLNS